MGGRNQSRRRGLSRALRLYVESTRGCPRPSRLRDGVGRRCRRVVVHRIRRSGRPRTRRERSRPRLARRPRADAPPRSLMPSGTALSDGRRRDHRRDGVRRWIARAPSRSLHTRRHRRRLGRGRVGVHGRSQIRRSSPNAVSGARAAERICGEHDRVGLADGASRRASDGSVDASRRGLSEHDAARSDTRRSYLEASRVLLFWHSDDALAVSVC